MEERPQREVLEAETARLFEVLHGSASEEEKAQARERVILLNRGLVGKLARKFARRGTDQLDDLMQVGMVGLINAVDRYQPKRGNKFATFAVPTITGEIKRYFRDRARAVRVPRRQQEMRAVMERTVEKLSQELGRAPRFSEVAGDMGLSVDEVAELQELDGMRGAVPLEAGDDEEEHRDLAEMVGTEDEAVARFWLRRRLREAMEALPAKQRHILELRFFGGLSQVDIAKKVRLSQMHVSRLQNEAIRNLRKILAHAEEDLLGG